MAAMIAAGAAIVGDIMSQQGQQQTNAQSMAIAQMNNEFNAQQAQMNRDFQQQQSATAVQTRVADMEKAGINPLLAAGNPAQAMPGSTASSAGLPQLNNPSSAFGQAGAQAAAAIQAGAQSKQAAANANLANAQASSEWARSPYAAYQAAASVQNTIEASDQARSAALELQARFDMDVQSTAGLMQNQAFQLEMFPLQKQLATIDVQREKLGMVPLSMDVEFLKGLSPQARTILFGAKEAMAPVQQIGGTAINAMKLGMMPP